MEIRFSQIYIIYNACLYLSQVLISLKVYTFKDDPRNDFGFSSLLL